MRSDRGTIAFSHTIEGCQLLRSCPVVDIHHKSFEGTICLGNHNDSMKWFPGSFGFLPELQLSGFPAVE